MISFSSVQKKVASRLESCKTVNLSVESLGHLLTVQKYSIRCTDTVSVEAALYDVACRSLKRLSQVEGKSTSTLQVKQREIFTAKDSDYGCSYKATGVVGILVRMTDKLKRLHQLDSPLKVKTESRNDTLLDLSIYSILGIMTINQN